MHNWYDSIYIIKGRIPIKQVLLNNAWINKSNSNRKTFRSNSGQAEEKDVRIKLLDCRDLPFLEILARNCSRYFQYYLAGIYIHIQYSNARKNLLNAIATVKSTKHESFAGETNRLNLQSKSSFMDQIFHCINFYCF